MPQAPPGKARRPAGAIQRSQRGDDRDGGTSGNAQDRRRGVRPSERRIGAMAAPSPRASAYGHASGHRPPGETCAREAVRPGSQGTTAGRGPWGSAGAAGRHRRTQAGERPGTPRPVPVPLRLERSAPQAPPEPARAFTTRAHHLEVARLARACGSLPPPRAPGGARGARGRRTRPRWQPPWGHHTANASRARTVRHRLCAACSPKATARGDREGFRPWRTQSWLRPGRCWGRRSTSRLSAPSPRVCARAAARLPPCLQDGRAGAQTGGGL